MNTVSVIIPCFNEEAVIAQTYKRLIQVVQSQAQEFSYELIFIDDGSADQTLEILQKLAEKDGITRVLCFSRNFGHQAAVSAGLEVCKGEWVAIIDADLQDPPEIIPAMIEKAREGDFDVVYGKRKKRRGESLFKLISAKIFYRSLNILSDYKFPADTGDFRVIRRNIVEVFNRLPEKNKYIRGLISWMGFRQAAFEYEREARFAGETKYTFNKMIKLAKDGIFSFSKKPLTLALRLGGITVFISILLMFWALAQWLFGAPKLVPGWTSLLVAVLFLGGVQLITIGILGEYLGNIFDEAKNRPNYIVRKTLNFSDPKE